MLLNLRSNKLRVYQSNVRFIGLGHMGLAMAQNILKAGFPLSVRDRTKRRQLHSRKREQIPTFSLRTGRALRYCCRHRRPNDAALSEIVDGPSWILHASKDPSIHISMSTVSPELVTALEKRDTGKKASSFWRRLCLAGLSEREKARFRSS